MSSAQHVFLMLFAVNLTLFISSAMSWDFISHSDSEDKGPSHWADTYPQCGGRRQSPINIELGKTEHKDLGDLALKGYNTSSGHGFKLLNNGHTVQLSVKSGPEMTLSGGCLRGKYKLVQFHFHWGKTDSVGSEHQIDGKPYPLEIHFVHFNKKYKNIDAALEHKDGIAVLGIFAQVGSQQHAGLDKLMAKFDDVEYKDSESDVDSFALRDILPSNINDFARYAGSLTTPPCSEAVIWTVFTQPITITSQQIGKFRTLKSNKFGETDEVLAGNFRPIQPLNGRTIYVQHEF